jgi:replicative DNA helicase
MHHAEQLYGKGAFDKDFDREILKTWNRDSLLNLLAGLIDTDGGVYAYAGKGLHLGFDTVSSCLAELFEWVVFRLFGVRMSRIDGKGERSHHIAVRTTSTYHVRRILKELGERIALERKRYKPEYEDLPSYHNGEHVGVSLGGRRMAEVWDLQVDNETHLYLLANEGLVTHNSVCIGQFALTAAQQGYRTLLQSAEMAAFQYLQRMAYYHAEVSYFRGMDGKTSDQEEKLVDAAEEDIGALPLTVDDLGSQNIDRIRRNIEQHEPDILFVDYLQYLVPDDPRAPRTQQVGQLSRDLARIKGDYNIPIVSAAQLNRKAEDRTDRRPMMSDLRDSGEIEQDADAIMLIHRPNRFKKDEEDNLMEIDCQKFRPGITWFAEFSFLHDQMFITEKQNNVVGRAS